MTNFSYDLVNLYYRGRSPLKKEDNSFFMCLYTMLVILFVLMCCLVLLTVLRFGKVEEEYHEGKHTEAYRLQNTVETTVKTTTLSHYNVPVESSNPESVWNWKPIIEFITGEEETTENESLATTEYIRISSSAVTKTEKSLSVKQIKNSKDFGYDSPITEISEKSTMRQSRTDAERVGSSATTQNIEIFSQAKIEISENPLNASSEISTLPKTSEAPSTKSENSYNDSYLFGISEYHFKPDRQSEEDRSADNKTFIFKNAGTCNTSNCLMTASRMISSMNMLVKPCNDFYSFSCGGASVEKREKFDYFAPNSMNDENKTKFLKKFHTFFQSCLHHEDHFDYATRIRQTKNLLKDIGFLQYENNSNSRIDLTQILSMLILFDVMPLFEVGIDVIPSISRYTISLTPPDKSSLNIEEWSPLIEIQRQCLEKTEETIETSPINITSLYNIYQTCRNNFSEYMTSFETAIKELGNFGNMTDEQITNYTHHITDFLEREIFSLTNKVSVVDQLMCVVEKQYEIISIQKLESEYSEIDWKRLLSLLSTAEIHNQSTILICNKAYFKTLFQRLITLDSKDVSDALSAIIAHKLFHNTILPTHRNSMMSFCNERTSKLMPNIANYIEKRLVSVQNLNRISENLENVFENIKQEFGNFLQNLEGLDENIIWNIKEKLSRVHLKMFSNENVDSERTFLEQVYGNLLLENNNHIHNYFYTMILRKKSIFSMYGQSVTAENTFRNIIGRYEEQPVYYHGSDFIFLSYSFMKKVSVDLPWYIKIAKIGFPLAKTLVYLLEPSEIEHDVKDEDHSLMHFFNNIKRDLSPLQNILNLGEHEIIFTLNDEVSRRERIADNIALKVLSRSVNNVQNYPLLPWISYEYSREKIFFLALVQELCQNMPLMTFMLNAHENSVLPSLLRTELMLRNCETFSTLFGCPPQEKDFPEETFLM